MSLLSLIGLMSLRQSRAKTEEKSLPELDPKNLNLIFLTMTSQISCSGSS